jgi:hypothetical protein
MHQQLTVVRAPIDTLPEVALLEIFDHCVWVNRMHGMEKKWYRLVHVCRKWRNVVFGSPLRLNLQLYCKARTPVRETLNVWPLLPIVVWDGGHETVTWGVDNIIAALEHNDRICQLDLYGISSSHYEDVLGAMQQPFPALTNLQLEHNYISAPPIIPASFLGGSAPSLESLHLTRIPFPGLPKLLLTATHLVRLHLSNIPHSGYISPETMATCLPVLTGLKSLSIGLESPRSFPDRKSQHSRPQTRTILPVLTELRFRGLSEYLEDLVARIETPLLDTLAITLFHQLILETPQLTQFISRTLEVKAYDEVHMVFSNWDVSVETFDGKIELGISCRQSDWQLSSLQQLCSSSFPHAFIPMVERVYILEEESSPPRWKDDMIENSQWLELLHPFTGVKGLYISREFSPRIAPALKELIGEKVTEVLPAMRTLFLEEPRLSASVQEAIEQFVAARQLASHPVTVFSWEGKQFKE